MARMRAAILLLLPIAAAAADDLLNPKALAPFKPATLSELRKNFADPPADYRSMPLWVWNDELAWPRLRQQLNQFRQQGIGGVFVHPRPGLMTEYLGEDWYQLWQLSVEEGKRLGLTVNIYDENSYPSGFAGGHVPSRAPDTAAQYVQAQIVDAGRISFAAADLVAAFAVENGKPTATRLRSRADVKPGMQAAAFRLRRASGNPWTGGFPYVDLTNPQTAPMFLETTFEAYKKRIGAEFGRTVKWVFDDEPLLATGGAYDSAQLALPLSYNTLAEFRKRCGYDLADHLASLYWDAGDFRRVRFDYWQTLHDLWKENYMRPLFQWCDRNGLQFTGHWMEHEWPYPWISPDDASLYAYEHVPGIDMLEGANLRLKGEDPHMLFTIKQVASVAHQLGRRAFCEAYGVAGWDSTFEHYKRFGDWLMAHGINFMDQHLAFSTVRGARKRDHPQSFTDVSPWWPYYRLHADHLARVSYLLARGEARNRVLVLEPTTSGFLWARRGGDTPELAKMRADNAELMQFLADRQVDYDLLDEYILEWFGQARGKQLRIGRAAYDVLVWPKNVANLRKESLPLLEKYLAGGGEVVALGEPAEYVDGRPSRKPRELREKYRAQWRAVASPGDLAAELAKLAPARVALDRALPQVGLSERFLASGERVLFFANTGLAHAKARATVAGGGMELWDTVSGRISTPPFTPAGAGRISFDVDLPPAGSQMFVVSAAGAPGAAPPAPKWQPVETGAWKAAADAPNVLVLDYCDLAVAGTEHRDINTWRANWTLWQAHGFERPAWDNAVQFRTRIFDRNRFGPESGFTATFRFSMDAPVEGLELAVETPELYRIAVNGSPVDFKAAEEWMDPHIRSAPIGGLARAGENVITLTGKPFDVRMELENVYLRGGFSAVAADRGFRMARAAPLALGSWAKQGRPFYAHAVTYTSEVTLPAGAARVRLALPKWEGTVAEVLLDGRRAALIAWPPHEAEFSAAPGRHTLAVRVVSTPRNVFGPFHNPAKPRMRAWPAAWIDAPEQQPAGARYDVLDYGLLEPPLVSAATR